VQLRRYPRRRSEIKTVGAITSIFNPAKGWTPIADAGSVQVAGDPSAAPDASAALQSFVAAGYFAVTIH
jgi:hypothetical protein